MRAQRANKRSCHAAVPISWAFVGGCRMRAQRANKRRMTLRNQFWLLTALRWLPTGFIVPVVALLPLERGLTIAEYGRVAAVQGIVVLLLELPPAGSPTRWAANPCSWPLRWWRSRPTSPRRSRTRCSRSRWPVGSPGPFVLSTAARSTRGSSTRSTTTRRSPSRPLIARGLSGYASVLGVSIATGAVLSGAVIAGGRSSTRSSHGSVRHRGRTGLRADPRRRAADARGPVRPERRESSTPCARRRRRSRPGCD